MVYKLLSEDQTTADRCAVIQGTSEQIAKATHFISELVHKSGAGGGSEMFYMHVPSNKTGLVIGKGGETIKQVRQVMYTYIVFRL